MEQVFIGIAKQNQDHLAARGLREQEIEVYLPKMFLRERVGRGEKAVGYLRLAPYMFLIFDAARGEGGTIKNTRGVQDLLCNKDGKPRALHEGRKIISELRQMEDEELSEAGRVFKKGRTDLERGMRVRIDKECMFQGREGIIAQLKRGKAKVFDGTMMIEIDDVDLTEIKGK